MNNGTRLKPVTNLWASIVSFSGRLHVASEMHSGISQPNRSIPQIVPFSSKVIHDSGKYVTVVIQGV
jgi:hypothetical protein